MRLLRKGRRTKLLRGEHCTEAVASTAYDIRGTWKDFGEAGGGTAVPVALEDSRYSVAVNRVSNWTGKRPFLNGSIARSALSECVCGQVLPMILRVAQPRNVEMDEVGLSK